MIKYTEYDKLPNYGTHVNLQEVIKGIEDKFKTGKKEWKSKFTAIDNLRILNKFHKKEINQLFQRYWKYIQISLTTGKTMCITKNILLFIKEVF